MSRARSKGIDTALVTDMLGLAMDDAFDVAVLVSADTDFVPAVRSLRARGRRVVHGGFPPRGRELAARCTASFDIRHGLHELAR